MEKIKKLERELEGKEEELEKVKKTKGDLARRGQRDAWELDESRRKLASVFADAELDENRIVEKNELKEKIKGLEEDIEDYSGNVRQKVKGIQRKTGRFLVVDGRT